MRQFFHSATDSYIGQGSAFMLGDTQYPANWIDHASVEEIAGLGLVEVVTVGERRDDRYFDNLETLSGATLTITAISREASAIHAAKWSEIKAERDRRIQSGGYLVAGKWFHSDSFSRTQQMGLVMLGSNIPPNTAWKTMDGSTVEMTQALAGQIFAVAAASDVAIFSAAEAHKAAMEVSDDPSAYDFSNGWPAIYGE